MVKIIYVIFGSTGMYEDFREWPVRAFATKAKANAYVKKLTKIKQGVLSDARDKDWIEKSNRLNLVMKVYDPNFLYDDGVDYKVVEVPMED